MGAASAGGSAKGDQNCPQSMLTLLRQGDTTLRSGSSETALPPRHPSQLYEALLEGLLLFAILFWVRWRWQRLPPRSADWALLHFVCTLSHCAANSGGCRMPRDSHGCIHSPRVSKAPLPMFVIGAGFLWHAWRQDQAHQKTKKSLPRPSHLINFSSRPVAACFSIHPSVPTLMPNLVTEADLPPNLRSLVQKAEGAIQAQNVGYAVQLLLPVVKAEPNFL